MQEQPVRERPARLLDLSRLLSRLHRRTPTGIDRVEFAYARHYLDPQRHGDVRCLVTTPVNTGLLSRKTTDRVMRLAQKRWFSADVHTPDPVFAELRRILHATIGESDCQIRSQNFSRQDSDLEARAIVGRAYAEVTAAGLFGRARDVGDDAWYLHVSHINLHEAARLRWMNPERLPALFMVHDLIPFTHPEYFLPGEDRRHKTRMQTLARLARRAVFNSRATQVEWNKFISHHRLSAPPGFAVPLGTENVFLNGGDDRDGLASAAPYFVVVGTLESRKNLSFLLHVWSAWLRASSAPLARLVIVGRRGRHSENTIDLIDRSPGLSSTIVEIAELGDAGLARLLRGARAMLAPSLIEGFGLPIAEALALGVPVVASNIPAHREVAGDCAEYLDPIDGPGWFQALSDYSQAASPRRFAMVHAAHRYHPQSWDAHFATIEELLTIDG